VDPDVIEPRADERLDASRVGQWIEAHVPGAAGTPEIWQFPGGHANLTYLIRYPSAEFVLRRPPHGDLAPGAHDMAREYRVLSVLHRAFPPAPRAFAFCEDASIAGAPFFVMERRRGIVVRRDVPDRFGGGTDPVQNRKLSTVIIDTLADFHRVDYREVGLEDLGKPAGYLARQVGGWANRWSRSATKPVPEADRVIAWLEDAMPATPIDTLVHNDWRLDNMAVAPDDPGRAVAVYDWDMCTLGDPLTDVGTLLSAWYEEGEAFDFLSPMPSRTPGFMTRAEAVARYGERRGIDVGQMPYYYVFGLFKMAVIVQQLYRRFHLGQTQDARMAGGETVAEEMIRRADAERARA